MLPSAVHSDSEELPWSQVSSSNRGGLGAVPNLSRHTAEDNRMPDTEWNWSKKTWRQAFGKEIFMWPGIGHYHQTDCSNPFQLKCKISTANNTCDLMTCFTLPWPHGWLGAKYQGSYQFVSHWESQNTQETNQSGQDSAYWKSENTHSLSSGCMDEVLLSVLRCQLTY